MPASEEEVVVKLTLRGRQQFSVATTASGVEIKELGNEAERAGKKARVSSAGFGFLGGTFSTVEKWAKRAAFGVAGLAGAVGVLSFKAFTDAEAITAQTNNTIRSTAGVAGITSKHVMDLANSVEAYGGQTNAAVRSTENLLLTFPKIRNFTGPGNDIFDQTTKAVVDMARTLHQPLKNTAIQVGKALQDPIKGLLALRRVGVAFSPEEQKRIQNLAKTGHLLQAQKMILQELNREFGGSEAAFGKTGAGKVAHFKAVIQDLGIAAGKTFVPLIAAPLGLITDKLSGLAKNTQGWGENVSKFMGNISAQVPLLMGTIRSGGNVGSVVDAMFGGTGALVDPINHLIDSGKALWHIFQDDLMPVIGLLAMVAWGAWRAFLNLDKPLGWVADHSTAMKPVIWALITAWGIHGGLLLIQVARLKAVAFWEAVSTDATLLWGAAVWVVNAGLSVLLGIEAALVTVLGVTAATIFVVIAVVALLALGFYELYVHVGFVHRAVDALWQGIQDGAHWLWNFFMNNWQDIIGIITLPFGGAVLIIMKHWDSIKQGFRGALNWVIDHWNGLEFKVPSFHIGPVHYGGGTVGVPDIPRLHSGGSTTSGGAAIIKPGEEMVVLPPAASVVPLPQAPQIPFENGPGGGTDAPDYLVVKLGGRVLLEAVRDGVQDEAARL